jgi:hypothetical protein
MKEGHFVAGSEPSTMLRVARAPAPPRLVSRARAPSLLGLQHLAGLHPERRPGRHEHRDGRDREYAQDDRRVGRRIGRSGAEQAPLDDPGQAACREHTEQHTEQDRRAHRASETSQHRRAGGAQRNAQPDLAAAATDSICHHTGDARGGEHQRQQPEGAQEQRSETLRHENVGHESGHGGLPADRDLAVELVGERPDGTEQRFGIAFRARGQGQERVRGHSRAQSERQIHVTGGLLVESVPGRVPRDADHAQRRARQPHGSTDGIA